MSEPVTGPCPECGCNKVLCFGGEEMLLHLADCSLGEPEVEGDE